MERTHTQQGNTQFSGDSRNSTNVSTLVFRTPNGTLLFACIQSNTFETFFTITLPVYRLKGEIRVREGVLSMCPIVDPLLT